MPPRGKYTDPSLRDEVKEEIQNSGKGGRPGQWSARKAQMMASEYKKRGGGYTTEKKDKDETQQNLTNWGEEDWQTKDGEGKAQQEDGTEKRYLPRKAWENMNEKEKEETDQKKQEESKEGKQHVGNTPKAKESRRKATKDSGKSDAKAKDNKSKAEDRKEETNGNASNGRSSRSQTKSAQEKSDHKESEEKGNAGKKGGEANDSKAKEGLREDDQDNEEGPAEEQPRSKSTKGSKAGQKRENTEQQNGSSKKQKDMDGRVTIGSKHMDATEPAQKGSADRLPKKGQKITWKAMPGYVEGTVKEVLKKPRTVDGKQVTASESDPRIVLESANSGKICVHKPGACYYDDE